MKDVTVKILESPNILNWINTYKLALGTEGKNTDKTPSDTWKAKLILSEHSPLRTLKITWEWHNLPYWVSVHLVRHKIGIEHFVQSQRNDRQDQYDRNTAPQNSPVLHRCIANYQAILNISRRRLCQKASPETRQAWMIFLANVADVDPILASLCVPSCVYRNGLCTEFKPCKQMNLDVLVQSYLYKIRRLTHE